VNGSEIAWTRTEACRTLGAVVGTVRRTALFLFLLLPAAAPAADSPRPVVCHRQGDDPRWAAPEWDDRDWAPGGEVPAPAGIQWIRFHLELPAGGRLGLPPPSRDFLAVLDGSGPIDCIRMAAPCSYELFWDGRPLGRSGVVGRTREEEMPGPLDNLFPIPAELLGRGAHVVAIRLSAWHYNFPGGRFGPVLAITGNRRIFTAEIRHLVYPLISLGGALIVALISGVLFWLVERWRPLLLCSIIGFALALFYFLIAWRFISNDPYDWLAPRLVAITWVMTFVAGIFPWLLLEQFEVPGRWRWLAAMGPVLAAAWASSPVYEIKTLWLCRAMLAASLGVAGWATWRRRPGAWCVLAVVLLGLLTIGPGRLEFLQPSFFATFGGLVLVVFATLGVQVRAHRRQAQAATLSAARLELELLKKNLQPHFLLNTLAALTETVEQDPRTAVKLIDDLAEELRSLARVSAEKLIPLAQELELCRAHLRVLSVRTGRAWRLEAAKVDGAAPVPPAVFLTLIENGFTHQRMTDGTTAFTLAGGRTADDAIRYTFLSPGQVQVDSLRPAGGTGLRYVRARLEESFPGRWSLRSQAVADGWETVIEIRAGVEGRPA
jgi:hypothetical protein